MAKDDRLYARLTLDFADSPKILPLSDAAFRGLVEMTLYSRRMMTDGYLASAMALARWGLDVCQELASNDPDRPSLIEVENGYLIHDFDKHQTTKAEIEALRAKRSAAGRRGGQARAKASAKQVLKQNASKVKPETETEIKIKDTPKPSSADAPNGFDEWWSVYPKRVGKGQARTAYAKAIRNVSAGDLLAGAERYRDDPKRKPDYTKNPSTWLNGECWADEAPVPAKAVNRFFEEI